MDMKFLNSIKAQHSTAEYERKEGKSSRKVRRITTDDEAWIVETAGRFTAKEVATHLGGCSTTTVYARAKALGVTLLAKRSKDER